MRIQKITSTAIMAVVLASSMVFIQCSDQEVSNEMQAMRAQFVKAERETPEMKAKRAEFYQRGIERINARVGEGKMDQAHANFALKQMANVNAFMDNNPEWTKYFPADRKIEGKRDGKFEGKKDGKFEGKKDGKKFEGKKDGKFEGKKFDHPKMDSAEMKANWEKKYQAGVERINQKAAEGAIEKAHADFLLKWMANDKAFKDANPEWTEYGFMKGFGKGFGHGERAKQAKQAK